MGADNQQIQLHICRITFSFFLPAALWHTAKKRKHETVVNIPSLFNNSLLCGVAGAICRDQMYNNIGGVH